MSTNQSACVLVIGNEILSGRTQDSNIQMLATGLSEIGVIVREARVIPDDRALIISTVNTVRSRFDIVFTTGGIGPTHDDITAECISEAFGVPLEENATAVTLLRNYYGSDSLSEARLRMARIPQGAELLENPVSQAPGFRLENVYVLAGVPRIAAASFELIKNRFKGGTLIISRALSASIRESDLARSLARIQNDFSDIEIGSYPFMSDDGTYGVSVVVRGPVEERLNDALAEVARSVRELGCEPSFLDHAEVRAQ